MNDGQASSVPPRFDPAPAPPSPPTGDRWLGVLLRREIVIPLTILIVLAGIAAIFYATQATTLTIAVAPRDGTEPALIQSYADALTEHRSSVRLKIIDFDDVSDSGRALQDGRADLAVVRPDVMMPTNGLTLAILRDQAMIIASPEGEHLKDFPSLAGKRLGIAAHREADLKILEQILGYYSLKLAPSEQKPVPRDEVALVSVGEEGEAQAIREKRIDAFVSIIAPSAPKAIAMIERIKAISPNGKVGFVQVADDDAVIERFPMLQSVTIPGGLFGGRPKLPDDDVKTIGAAYRLMARASLSRSLASDLTQQLFELRTIAAAATDAANYVKAPSYDTTVVATSAQIPNHPGALDYFERDQHGFIERYGDSLYLLGALIGALASAGAWLRERVIRLRREHVDDLTDRLLEITAQARNSNDATELDTLLSETDQLAVGIVRYFRDRDPDAATVATVGIAIDTARRAATDRRAEIRSSPPRDTTPS